jgi:hypothetical protein
LIIEHDDHHDGGIADCGAASFSTTR